MQLMYYVYTHTRKDNNEVFYVGMAKISSNKNRIWQERTKYERAYKKRVRNKLWNKVLKETEYLIEIVFEFDSYKDACDKEKELITKYGRKDFGGILTNSCPGGLDMSGKRKRECSINQIDVLTGKLIKTWEQPREIEEITGFLKTNIVKCCRKKQITAYGYKWEYYDNDSFKNVFATASRKNESCKRKWIEVYDLKNTLIFTGKTINEVSLFLNINKSTVHRYLNNSLECKYFTFKRVIPHV